MLTPDALTFERLSGQLAVAGMQASWASHGLGAAALHAQASRQGVPFSVAIVDTDASPKDAEVFLNALTCDPVLGQVPVLRIVSTGKYVQFSGTQASLRKPLRQSELYKTIERLIGKVPTVRNPETGEQNGDSPSKDKETTEAEALTTDNGLVLVVEDNTVNQKIVLRMLSKLGYRADVAGNGNEAIAAVHRVPYDAVLMDCQMPEMDGFEATSRIRKNEAGAPRHTPIIAMTAHALKGDRERCLKSGMDDYLAKPVKLEALKEILERCLSPAPPSPPGHRPPRSQPAPRVSTPRCCRPGEN